MLKQQIRELQAETSASGQLSSELSKSAAEIQTLKAELFKTRENNDSLMMMFEAYKRVLGQSRKTQPERPASNRQGKDKEPSIFESLRQRMRLRQDADDLLVRKQQTTQPLPSPSAYSQCYLYEFADCCPSRWWEAEVLALHSSPKPTPKLLAKLRSSLSKHFFPEQYRHIFWSWVAIGLGRWSTTPSCSPKSCST